MLVIVGFSRCQKRCNQSVPFAFESGMFWLKSSATKERMFRNFQHTWLTFVKISPPLFPESSCHEPTPDYIIQHDIENDPKYSELKQKFYHRAKGIVRWHTWHTWRIVSFILLGYSYILYLSYAWYPEQAGRVIPEWLIPYL